MGTHTTAMVIMIHFSIRSIPTITTILFTGITIHGTMPTTATIPGGINGTIVMGTTTGIIIHPVVSTPHMVIPITAM